MRIGGFLVRVADPEWQGERTVTEKFERSFTQQEPIPEEAIARAVEVMRHGRLHRYNAADGEVTETELLEREFADFVGARYCLAVASCGYAISCALRAIGVRPGDPVLMNAFTLAPVPGAIAGIGARPALVETTRDLVVDFADLKTKAGTSGAKVLVLSHMRGHICDMDQLADVCDRAGVSVIEDCAHTMGGGWDGVPSGRHGMAACYSTQTYKHMNSGEGGLIVSDDSDFMAAAIVNSGSYMNFGRHVAAPPAEAFRAASRDVPNCSGRMDNLRAALLRPQLRRLEAQCVAWNERYAAVEDGLRRSRAIRIVERPAKEQFVGSSIQFELPGFSPGAVEGVVSRCKERGVVLKWFGRDEPVGFTSRYDSWRFIEPQSCPKTDRALACLLDMRLPLTFSIPDCAAIAAIIVEEADRIGADGKVPEKDSTGDRSGFGTVGKAEEMHV